MVQGPCESDPYQANLALIQLLFSLKDSQHCQLRPKHEQSGLPGRGPQESGLQSAHIKGSYCGGRGGGWTTKQLTSVLLALQRGTVGRGRNVTISQGISGQNPSSSGSRPTIRPVFINLLCISILLPGSLFRPFVFPIVPTVKF